MCMTCVSQSAPYVAMALGGLNLPRALRKLGVRSEPEGEPAAPSTIAPDGPTGTHDDSDIARQARNTGTRDRS